MKTILLLLAILGATWAVNFKFPVEYHYEYTGRLAIGIPSTRSQVSATGLKAKVILQMKSETQGLIKIHDIEVGTYNDDMGCENLRQVVPINYSPLAKNLEALLETPFGVNFDQKGHVMTVPKSDVEYITNIRKSIVGILRTSPKIRNQEGLRTDEILSNLKDDEILSKVFSTEEDTIFGRCESQYTFTRLMTCMNVGSVGVTGDDQSTEGDRPILGEKKWRLIKSINFNKCHDQVTLLHSGTAKPGLRRMEIESLPSRSSVSSYVLVGDGSYYRIESAVVEGNVALSSFGYNHQWLQSITNQTLYWKSTSTKSLTIMKLPVYTRKIKTWNYEVASPFSKPSTGSGKPWMNYYENGGRFAPIPALGNILGLEMEEKNIKKIKEKIQDMLEEIIDEVDRIPGTPNASVRSSRSIASSTAMSQMLLATKMIRYLKVEDIEDIFTKVNRHNENKAERKLMLLIDIAAASGAAPPMKVLLEKIKKGELSNIRTASIFMTLTNHLVSPVIIPELMEYVMSMDVEKEPFLSSVVLINFATMVHRVCISQIHRNYSVPNPLYGKEECQSDSIIMKFLPHLVVKAETSSEDWHIAIYIEAISSLGSAHALKPLKRFITGKVPLPMKIRQLAISALTSGKMPNSVRSEVFEVLMGIVDNLEENSEIRQNCLKVLLTWQPEASWWQRMARMMWREPSQAMVTFFFTTTKGLASATDPRLREQAKIASLVLPLLRPAFQSMRSSYNYIYSKYDSQSKITFNVNVASIKNQDSLIPSDLNIKMQNSLGGFSFDLFELGLSPSDLYKLLDRHLKFFDIQKNKSSQLTSNLPALPKEILPRMMDDAEKEDLLMNQPESIINLKMFDSIKALIPLNFKTILSLIAPGSESEKLLREFILEGRKLQFLKFFNPIEIEYFIPTELGLPIIGSVSLPTMNFGNVEMKLQYDRNSTDENGKFDDILSSKNYDLSFTSNYRLMSKLVVNLKTFLPWDETFVEAGVESFKELHLPTHGSLSFSKNDFNMEFSPATKLKYPLVYAHNLPYTSITPLYASSSRKEDFKIIFAHKLRQPMFKSQETLPLQSLGQKMTLDFAADKPYPFTKYNAIKYLSTPESLFQLLTSPSSNFWQLSLNVHPSESKSQNVSVTIMHFAFYPDNIPTTKNGEENFYNVTTFKMPDFSATDSVRQRLMKLKEFSSDGTLDVIFTKLTLSGSEYHHYEGLLAFLDPGKPNPQSSPPTSSAMEYPTKDYFTQIAFLASTDIKSDSTVYCLRTEMKVPVISHFEDLLMATKAGLKESIKGHLHYGLSCNSNKIASFDGYMKLSQERQSYLAEELKNKCDQEDSLAKLRSSLVYDEGKMDINYSWDKFSKSVRNLTFSAEKLLEQLVFPHAYFNKYDVHNPQDKLSIKMKRSLSSQYYSFWIHKPKENVFVSEIPISNVVTEIISFDEIERTSGNVGELYDVGDASEICEITAYKHQLRTFDGFRYPYYAQHCWTLAFMDSSHQKDPHFLVATRSTELDWLEARIILTQEGITCFISKSYVRVNGKDINPGTSEVNIRGTSGKVVMRVRRIIAGYRALVIDKMLVVAMHGVYISPHPSIKKNVTGTCGNYDGYPNNDLVGPAKCIYSDPELFKYAWTNSEGLKCDMKKLEHEHQLVKKFQKTCKKALDSPLFSDREIETTSLIVGDPDDSCKMMVYPIERWLEDGLCVANNPTPVCKSICTVDYAEFKIVKDQTKCWPAGKIPKEVEQAMEIGYLLHPVKESAAITREIDVVHENHCLAPRK